jgi:hypothetical protein
LLRNGVIPGAAQCGQQLAVRGKELRNRNDRFGKINRRNILQH